ncbi:MAG: alpha/beta fold hydrolase [Gammaproteobacteria bacterium]|nr:alpha/beta fold hydrolase [Gammaproteobacteria bacterium]
MIKVGSQLLRTAIWRGTGNARPVLFFNGIGANLETMAPLGEMMADRCDVITFDMPGIGGSPDARLPYRPSKAVKWAKKILEHYDIDEVDVMGVSWGGGMAQQFARNYPKCAKALVLLATSAGTLMVPGNFSALSRMAQPKRYTDPNYMMKNFKTLYGEAADGSSEGHKSRIKPPTRKGYAFQLTAMVGWTSLHFLPFLKQPTLIMSGNKDNIVPLVNARILKAAIPRADLRIVRGGGHLFMVSRTKEIVPVIARFLDDYRDETTDCAA